MARGMLPDHGLVPTLIAIDGHRMPRYYKRASSEIRRSKYKNGI